MRSYTNVLFTMVMRRNVDSCVCSAVSVGDRPICTKILPWQGRPPSAILGVRKLETLGYLMVKTISLCLPSIWHNTRVWRSDRRTDGFAVAYTKLALRSAVKSNACNAYLTHNIGLLFVLTTLPYAYIGIRNHSLSCFSDSPVMINYKSKYRMCLMNCGYLSRQNRFVNVGHKIVVCENFHR